MKDYVNQNSFYNELVMLLEAGRRIIVTEGDVDYEILKKHIHDDARIVMGVGGREHVLKAADAIYDQGYIDALFLVDKDFDNVIKSPRDFNGNVIPSKCHDFVMDLIDGSPVLIAAILDQILSRARRSPKNGIRDELTATTLIDKAMDYAFIMSAVRIHSLNTARRWKLSESILTTFGCRTGSMRPVVERVLQKNKQDTSSENIEDIVGCVEKIYSSWSDDRSMLVGDHDFFDALSAVCRSEGILVSSDDLSDRVVGAVRCDVIFNVFWYSEIEKWCRARGWKGLACPCCGVA